MTTKRKGGLQCIGVPSPETTLLRHPIRPPIQPALHAYTGRHVAKRLQGCKLAITHKGCSKTDDCETCVYWDQRLSKELTMSSNAWICFCDFPRWPVLNCEAFRYWAPARFTKSGPV